MTDDLGYEPVTDPAVLRRFFGVSTGHTAPAQRPLDGMAPVSARHTPTRLAGEREPLGYRLFFAGFAEPQDSARLCQRGGELARAHGLRDAVQTPDRAHITLCDLNKHHILDEAVIAAACAAANNLPCPALDLVFDRAGSFASDGAFMLKGDAATELAIARLRRPLVSLLRRFGLRPAEVTKPHMTMVYNCGQVVAEHAITPLPWTLRRFALVLSHVGNSRHECLGEWTLPRT